MGDSQWFFFFFKKKRRLFIIAFLFIYLFLCHGSFIEGEVFWLQMLVGVNGLIDFHISTQ